MPALRLRAAGCADEHLLQRHRVRRLPDLNLERLRVLVDLKADVRELHLQPLAELEASTKLWDNVLVGARHEQTAVVGIGRSDYLDVGETLSIKKLEEILKKKTKG